MSCKGCMHIDVCEKLRPIEYCMGKGCLQYSNLLQSEVDRLKNEVDILVKYHPSTNYSCQISNPYGVFFCKKEEDYVEFKREIEINAQKECVEFIKCHYKDTRFAYDAESLCEELDSLFIEMTDDTI